MSANLPMGLLPNYKSALLGWLSRILLRLAALLLAGSVLALPAQGQTTQICLGRVITPMDFSGTPVLQSGTALSVNAVYRYTSVTTGIDALVKIVALNNGASLVTIDNNTAPAAGAPDLRPFFDPELGGSNARSVDFQFTFVVSGTNTPIVLDFVGTGIDIDGDGGSLREFAEFQNTYAEYLLNNPTNLSVNASAPAAGNTRFESATSLNAPGIDPSANQNIVAAFYSKTSAFNYRIGALGTGATVRLTSLQFTCPNLPAPISTATAQDFGDAPASYGNVRHDVVTGFRMGTLNTVDTGPYNSATASGDSGDDGVTIAALRQGQPATATVTVAGTGGRLQAWFDWNRDGDFLDAGEQVAANLTDNGIGDGNAATGTIVVSFTVPSAAVMGQTFARFRWSTQTGLDPFAIIGHDGEVEDYAASVGGTAILASTKASVVYSANTTPFFIPGNDVIYTVQTTNNGTAATDSNSVFALDALPPQVELYVGDFDGAGPATGSVLFTQSAGAGLTFTLASDLRYSNAASAPANFAACTYSPTVTNAYDPAIRYICVNPKGAMASGTPAPNFTLEYKSRIK